MTEFFSEGRDEHAADEVFEQYLIALGGVKDTPERKIALRIFIKTYKSNYKTVEAKVAERARYDEKSFNSENALVSLVPHTIIVEFDKLDLLTRSERLGQLFGVLLGFLEFCILDIRFDPNSRGAIEVFGILQTVVREFKKISQKLSKEIVVNRIQRILKKKGKYLNDDKKIYITRIAKLFT